MTTVAIDCRFAGSATGLGRYSRELMTALAAREDGLRYTVLARSADEPWLTGLPDAVRRIAAPFPHYSVAEQTRLPRLLADLRVDGFFSTHFNVPLRCPPPFVATVHDLILHRYPNGANPLKVAAYRFLMRRTVGAARRVITVSRFVAGELERAYGKDIAAKTTVVTEGVSPLFTPRSDDEQRTVRLRHRVERPFFLYVGNAKQHKNVPLLLEAYGRLPEDRPDLLLVTGGPEAAALRLPAGARLLAGVPDADLPALYSAAVALVTASAYEGFCLPVAEAAACGCPVIATDASAIPEIAPAGSALLPPTVDAFASALAAPPARLPSRAAIPSWDRAAAETARLLKETFR